MKTLAKIVFSITSSAMLLAYSMPVMATTPMLSVTQQGNNIAKITVNADPYAQIALYRRQTTQLWTIINNFGQTDGSGYFSQNVSLGSDNTNNVIEQYVVVNGQQSSIVQTYANGYIGGCTYNCGNGNTSLSQTNITLNIGQSMVVTAYNTNGYVYVTNNSNSSVASAVVNGNQVTVYGYATGSATMNVCSSVNNNCANLFVTVNGYNYNNNNNYNNNYNLTFSQGSVSMQVGQTQTVSVYSNDSNNNNNNYNNNYNYNYNGIYISSNSNSNAVRASVSGSVLTLYGNTNGYATIVICQNNNSANCGTINVTVNGYGSVLGSSTYNNGQLINESGTVYIIYKNTKTAFSSAKVFQNLGFNFGNVFNDGYTNLYSSGYTVTNSNASHPWGSWIKSGSTVYFVHELGLIPVSDYSTFLNNGGQDSMVVQANSWDFSRPILSVMVYSDARLR